MIDIVFKLNNLGVSATVVLHDSDKHKIINFLSINYFIYSNLDDLFDKILDTGFVISVDTFQLHLSEYFEVPVYALVSNGFSFIPPHILNDNKFSYFNNVGDLISTIRNDLNLNGF